MSTDKLNSIQLKQDGETITAWLKGVDKPLATFQTDLTIDGLTTTEELYSLANKAADLIGCNFYGIDHDRWWFFMHTDYPDPGEE